ncbi:MAG TPA: hypothetical protein VGJ65_16025 [Albitalea sp.]|jgi:hypothetical protein
MTPWRPLSAAALVAAACTGALAADPDWGLKATGLAGAPLADGEGRSARVAVEPSLKWKLPSVDLKGSVRLRWLEQEREQRSDTDVRELTATWRGARTTFALGAQQVNWGRMDILRVSDIVNPVDQHDLFYEELPQAKLALWMANWEWQEGGQSLQVIATPQVPVDRLPARVAGVPVNVARPANSLAHSTLALRYGFEAAGWNADLVAIRGWQSTPLLRPALGATGVSLQGSLARQNSIGFSADKPLGGTVLRLEGLYARATPEDPGLGLTTERSASLGAGLDLRTGPWFFATQVIAQQNFDAIAGTPERTAVVSAIVQRKWLQDRLSGRALHIRESAFGSSWSSLQASYELSAHQLVQLQSDWFRGESTAPFGGFRGRSRVAASMRVQF